jgi:hypothetical protein
MLLIGVKLCTSQRHLMAGIIQNKLVTFLDSYKHIKVPECHCVFWDQIVFWHQQNNQAAVTWPELKSPFWDWSLLASTKMFRLIEICLGFVHLICFLRKGELLRTSCRSEMNFNFNMKGHGKRWEIYIL